MRFRASRLMGVPILSLFLGLSLGACSGSQQDQEGLEVENQQGQYADNQYAENEYGQSNEYAEGQEGEYADGQEGEYADGQYADEGGEGLAQEGYGYEGGDAEYAEGNATENDLQEIIQEMNGEGDAVAEEPYDAGSQDMVDAGAGYNAGMAPTPTSGAMGTDPMMASMGGAGTGAPNLPFQPGGTPAGQSIPEMGSKMAYIVQPGDTLAQISQKIYGNMGRWQEMASLSGMSNPSRIYPGDVVYYTLDDASVPFATAYEQVQRSEEQVQAGDTLATIAQRVYGSSKGWKAIWRQNDAIGNPDVVSVGTVVYYISSSNLALEVAKQKAIYAALKQKIQTPTMALEANTEDTERFSTAGILLADGRLQDSFVQFLI